MLRRHLAGLALATLALPASAQGDKIARLVIGFPAGQATDVIARLLADGLKGELGETVIVDNKPGQGGSIALGLVARAAPDGTTMILAPLASLVINPHLYKNVAYNTFTSFAPVARVCDLPLVLVVHPSLPVKTLPELIAYAKANPDKLSHPSAGNGTLSHVVMEDFKARAGIRILHVPYQGSPPAMNDLVAGNVQVAMDTVTVTKPLIDSGKLRLIAAGTLQRLPAFPRHPDHRRTRLSRPRSRGLAWRSVSGADSGRPREAPVGCRREGGERSCDAGKVQGRRHSAAHHAHGRVRRLSEERGSALEQGDRELRHQDRLSPSSTGLPCGVER